MTKTIAHAAILALGLGVAMLPASGWAQGSLPCTGSGTDDNGTIHTGGFTPAGGVEAQCDGLVSPTGRVTIQDGPAADAPDGVDAAHEGAGGGHTS